MCVGGGEGAAVIVVIVWWICDSVCNAVPRLSIIVANIRSKKNVNRSFVFQLKSHFLVSFSE